MVAIFADGLTTVTRQGATKMKMIVNVKSEFIGHYIVSRVLVCGLVPILRISWSRLFQEILRRDLKRSETSIPLRYISVLLQSIGFLVEVVPINSYKTAIPLRYISVLYANCFGLASPQFY